MNKKIKEACESSEMKERIVNVAKILEAVKYSSESDRADAILSFSKANLTLEEVENLVKPLRSDYLEGQIYKRGIA